MARLAGLQALRVVPVLQVTGNARLGNIDGLSGIVNTSIVTINNNPSLCYILFQAPNSAYWKVNLQLLFKKKLL